MSIVSKDYEFLESPVCYKVFTVAILAYVCSFLCAKTFYIQNQIDAVNVRLCKLENLEKAIERLRERERERERE